MSEIEQGHPTPSGIGLTVQQKKALDAITGHVAAHGVMPSRSSLAAAMGCSKNNATQLMMRLIERGELSNATKGGALTGFGSDGVSVFVPAHLAAELAAFCHVNSEKLTAVVADAIALHLDQLGEVVE